MVTDRCLTKTLLNKITLTETTTLNKHRDTELVSVHKKRTRIFVLRTGERMRHIKNCYLPPKNCFRPRALAQSSRYQFALSMTLNSVIKLFRQFIRLFHKREATLLFVTGFIITYFFGIIFFTGVIKDFPFIHLSLSLLLCLNLVSNNTDEYVSGFLSQSWNEFWKRDYYSILIIFAPSVH